MSTLLIFFAYLKLSFSWLLLPIYYYCFWVFYVVDFILILINLIDTNLLFFIAIFFIFFIAFIKDILSFIFNIKNVNSANSKTTKMATTRLSLLVPFRFLFNSLKQTKVKFFFSYIWELRIFRFFNKK